MIDVERLADAVAERVVARQPDDRPLFTVASLAEFLGISERVMREMLADEVIPSYKVGGGRRIDPKAVDAYLAARRAEGRPDGD